jgi:hypothetical protein
VGSPFAFLKDKAVDLLVWPKNLKKRRERKREKGEGEEEEGRVSHRVIFV